MKYAAYDKDTIYEIGDTPIAAIAKARINAKNPDAQFNVAPIRDGLADAIEEAGWNPHLESFAIDNEGFIVDTTRD